MIFIHLRPKTKELLNKINQFGNNKILIMIESVNDNLLLAARNLPKVEVCTLSSLSPVALINSDTVIATSEAIKQIEERLG